MKIAACFSGKPSSLDFIKNIKINIIDILKADCFLTSWIDDFHKIKEIQSILPPKAISLSSISSKTWEGIAAAKESNLDNILKMWYQVYKSNQLKNEYEKLNGISYDLVFRLRYDTTFDNKFDISILDGIHNYLMIPEQGDHRGGLCDILAFGNKEKMDVYSNLYDYLIENLNNKAIDYVHPENLLRKYVKESKLAVKRFPLKTYLRGHLFLNPTIGKIHNDEKGYAPEK